jgi:predicted DNA-binding transcriptional regulator YafY
LERLRQLGFDAVPEAADGSLAIAKAPPRRAPATLSRRPSSTELPTPDETLLGAAVRALRAGDRARAERPPEGPAERLRPTGPAHTIAALRDAMEANSTVWIGYVDNHGMTSERLVDPAGLDGGVLSAFDHRAGEVRTFAVHRISGVATVDD